MGTTRGVVDIDRRLSNLRWVAKQADTHGDPERAAACRARIDELLDERLTAARQ